MLNVTMVNVITHNVIMASVVILMVIMLNVVAPWEYPAGNKIEIFAQKNLPLV
jgi:hypothetical protein